MSYESDLEEPYSYFEDVGNSDVQPDFVVSDHEGDISLENHMYDNQSKCVAYRTVRVKNTLLIGKK